MSGESARKSMESDPEDFSDETNTENLYGTSPPSTPRQMKRLSAKHQRNSAGRPASRSNLKGEPVTSEIHRRGVAGVEHHRYGTVVIDKPLTALVTPLF